MWVGTPWIAPRRGKKRKDRREREGKVVGGGGDGDWDWVLWSPCLGIWVYLAHCTLCAFLWNDRNFPRPCCSCRRVRRKKLKEKRKPRIGGKTKIGSVLEMKAIATLLVMEIFNIIIF